MNEGPLKATALVARNSLAYVDQVFSLGNARRAVVAVPTAAAAPLLAGIQVEGCIEPAETYGWYGKPHALIHDERTAQVAFTSGTEGKPKGIVLSYANLADTAQRIIQEMRMTSDIREYVGVPVTYSFGMGRFRAISAVGGKAYLSPRGFDPLEVARMLAAGEINSLSAVPTLLRILLANPEIIGAAGKKLRWMEIGSQYMTAEEKSGVRALFPNARIVQHYGLTEASRSTFLQISESSKALLGSVGKAVGSTEVAIGPDGRVKIRGPHVAKWRIDSDGQRLALLDDDGWLVTNDLGRLENGILFYDGRADDVINIGGIKVFPDVLEARIRDAIGQDAAVAVARVPDAVRGEGILVATETDGISVNALRAATVGALKSLGVEAGNALHVRTGQALPRTATGKPQRRLLADTFVAENPAPSKPGHPAPFSADGDVLSFFQRAFPGEQVGPEDNFETLGGDSLLYIRFSMDLERRFGALPAKWEAMSVAQLQARLAGKPKTIWRRIESATWTRALAMIFIVALHMHAFVYSRNWGAAYFLIMLAGYSVIRFQLPEITRSGSVKTLLGTVVRIAIPTALAVATVQLWAGKLEVKPLLLFSNFFDPRQYKVVYFYFVEFYMQLLLMAAVLFSFSAVRSAFQKHPMKSAFALLIAAEVAMHVMDSLWDTNYLYHRTPINYAWAFACGVLMACASDMRTRLTAMLIVVVATWWTWGTTSAMFYVDAGCAALLFAPAIRAPAPIKTVIGEIAGSSMFIFLTHWHVQKLVTRLFGHEMPWIALIAALVAGVLFARIYTWADMHVRRLLAEHIPLVRAAFR